MHTSFHTYTTATYTNITTTPTTATTTYLSEKPVPGLHPKQRSIVLSDVCSIELQRRYGELSIVKRVY